MDHSSDASQELLHQLKTSISDGSGLKHILPALVGSFERESLVLTEIISFLLGPTVQSLPLEDVNNLVLQPFLPQIKLYLTKVLSTIHKMLELNVFEDSTILEIQNSLKVCVQIMVDLDNLLSYLTCLEEISVSDVFSLPNHVGEIVHQVYMHCQKSEEVYGEIFTTVRSELMCLFQKCYKVQVSFFKILNEKLSFNCAFENELQLLLDVLDILSSMSEVVADLDTLSLVAHWKGYAQLTQTYAPHLCSRLDVVRPINYLAGNIHNQLSNLKIYINAEKKGIMRSLKITGLQLKVLLKLCEQFKGYLGDCQAELLKCLISLSGHTVQYLNHQGLTEDISSQITTHLCAGAAPLLSHLITDPLFVKEYLKYTDHIPSSYSLSAQIGCFHLTNLIFKKIFQLHTKFHEIQVLWLEPNLSLVRIAFRIIDHYCKNEEFVAFEDDFYQALLIHVAAFVVITHSSDTFPCVEELLIEQLLQPHLWPAVFSSDLFCLIARFGTSELCLQLTSVLSDLLSCWQVCDCYRPEWVYVSWTMGRLTKLLSDDHFQAFTSHLPSLHSLASDIETVLHTQFSDETVILYQSLIERLSLFGDNMALMSKGDHSISEALYQLWQCVTTLPQVESTGCETSHWFLGFFSTLVMATSSVIHSFSNCQIGHVLDVLTEPTHLNTILFHCCACEILRSLAEKTFVNDSGLVLVCHRISLVFSQLMQDKNPLKKQIALETFSFFAYLTQYEEIVATIVASDVRLQTEITNYLEGICTTHSDVLTLSQGSHFYQSFKHKCKNKNRALCKLEKDLEPSPCKKIKTSLNEELVSAALQRIEHDVVLIEEYSRSNLLEQQHISSLQDLMRRFEDIMKI